MPLDTMPPDRTTPIDRERLARLLRLMVITDGLRTDGLRGGANTLVDRIAAAVRGGATCVQVRLKDAPARTVVDITRAILTRVDTPVLVNDRFDVALAAGAHGVHLGADDVPVADVRRVTPQGFLIGASVGCDAEVANAAEADYVGIGPIFATGSKADAGEAIGVAGFARLAAMTGKPAVGVGGITAETARALFDAGGVGVAVIGAIVGAPDPERAARRMVQMGCATES